MRLLTRFRCLVGCGMSIGLSIGIAASCSTDDFVPEFREDVVAEALDTSGLVFDTPEERSEAISSFRTICVTTPVNSVNDFSVFDMIRNPGDYPDGFAGVAELGCPNRFATVREMIASGDCFGGAVPGCDD